ncbi:hypothetical protein LKD70_09350 [Ruminococcus sp. CLA-AA-H200]|uniref:Uncharacterized protein n=1 Tax=Ruminococcus turbiniformis TaxID=2881258 RepID=A0ABS8FX56_9FIRM|nr:hypothetical protein [Ruminococcus turbiniformis]MCC2254621.1 hypothetical protein [Ruminococcus turbiniformis]
MGKKEFCVIGTAKLDMDKFRSFRTKEREKRKKKEKCWPAEHWQNYFYQHQDLARYAEEGYCDKINLNHTPADSFDKKVEATAAYLDAMGLSWDLLFDNEMITIIRYGELSFGLPPELVECHFYTDLDHDTIADLRQRIGAKEHGMNAIVPYGGITKAHMTDEISSIRGKIEEKKKEIEDLEKTERKEIEKMRLQIKAKYQEQFDLINEKKREMELMMERLENQLFVLDTELYSIRCFMGETVQFVQLRTGKHAPVDTPVILYQKMRYLDEEMGKFLAVYQFDSEDKGMFEEVLKYRDDLFNLFAPSDKSISLTRISRNNIQYGNNPVVANMLEKYNTFHGSQVGILIRDGGNLWIGWTEEERINITEDVFLKPKTDITTVEDYSGTSTKEEIASRYFLFSILQGVLHNNQMLHLPEGTSVFKKSPYVVFSMADAWLEDNRFGSFSEIVERTNQPLHVGDMVLTTLHITRDDRYTGRYGGRPTYTDAWNNNRGRGSRNRTHDASIPNMKVIPVNLIDTEETYCILYDIYESTLERFPTEKEGVYTYSTTRTDKKIGEGIEDFQVWNGFYDNMKDEKYDLRGLTEDEIYQWYMARDRKNWNTFGDSDLIDPMNETASYKVAKGIRKKNTWLHYYLSAEKEGYWDEKKSYANMEIEEGEYLNLTYLNSVYVLYAIQNRKIGGWVIGGHTMDYANSIQYLNIALEYLRKREEKEAQMLEKYMDLYPDWQVDLSEWRLENGYHRLTDARAKKFAKYKAAKGNN